MRGLGRITWRSLWMAGEILLVFARFAVLLLRCAGRPSRHQRAEWLHQSCRRVLRVFVNEVAFTGPRPHEGLLICNHLTYLDILLLSAISPCVFISKFEVKYWPVFGWFASLGGTVFVRRERRAEVGGVAEQIRRLLAEGLLVVLFPEGTSSNGQGVLPFKSALLEPAVGQTSPLFAASLDYSLADGVVANDVCYWGDMTLLPHFLNLLKKSFVQARVHFAEVQKPASDRKALARQLQAEVVRLQRGAPSSDPTRFGQAPRHAGSETGAPLQKSF